MSKRTKRSKRDLRSEPVRTLVLGDIHFKWNHKAACKTVIEAAAELQPERIIQIGDEHDFYLFSRYPTDPNVIKPDDELKESRDARLAFWKEMHRATPTAEKIRMMGNHDDRALKRIAALAPQYIGVVGEWLDRWMETPNTSHHKATELVADKVLYEHGDLSKLGDHAKRNLYNTVVGHSHTGGVVYFPKIGEPNGIFELNVGWLGDRNAPVFRYYRKQLVNTTTLGFGWLDEYGPRFCKL